jgi:acetoin utilization deacetylase AcuC-like enzyme
MSFLLFYTDCYELPLPAGHRFPIGKYSLLRKLLAEEGGFDFQPAPMAEAEVIEMAHDPDYVRQFLKGELAPAAMRRIGFPWSQGLVRRTLASAGGTLAATRVAMQQGWGGNLAGGTHHAFYSEGSGYCVFNDIAVAVLWARKQFGIAKAAVLDLDVHQGDGTASILRNDADALTISMHCAVNFPFRKQESGIDVELPEGTGDVAYLHALDQVLDEMLSFRPEILFYQSGVDGLAEDALGRLNLTLAGLAERDRRVVEFARSNQVPLVITLGGGYAKPIELTVEAHANTYRTAAEIFSRATRATQRV